MKTKQRVQIESPTSEIRRVVVESGDERELCLISLNNARKRRLKVKQQINKNACMHGHEKFKNGTCKTVSYGLVSVAGRRKEMEDAVRVELGFLQNTPDRTSRRLVLTNEARNSHSSPKKDRENLRIVKARSGDVSAFLLESSSRRLVLTDHVRDTPSSPKKDNDKYDFFGVFDGHGGARVAEACRERLHELVASAVAGEMGRGCCGDGEFWERVMEESFVKMDEFVMSDERFCGGGGGGDDDKVALMRTMGSTAVVAVVGKGVVVVANCGDSRAVMSRDGVAVALSNDHKPNRPDELQRIEAAGGRVINWNGHRVLGVLATSRSIGDQYLKPYVIPKPEVTVTNRAITDEYLILASDGLWDVVSNDIACQVVRRYLNNIHLKKNSQDFVMRSSRTDKAAAALTKLAMSRGSTDNISVLVVDLRQVQLSY